MNSSLELVKDRRDLYRFKSLSYIPQKSLIYVDFEKGYERKASILTRRPRHKTVYVLTGGPGRTITFTKPGHPGKLLFIASKT